MRDSKTKPWLYNTLWYGYARKELGVRVSHRQCVGYHYRYMYLRTCMRIKKKYSKCGEFWWIVLLVYDKGYKYTGARTYEYLCLIGIQILYTLLINRIEKLRRGSRNVVFGSATLSQRSCQLFHGALRVSSGKLDYSDFKFQVSVRLEKPDSSRGIILG